MAGIKTEGIVLRKINFRETSVLLDIFTRELGKVRGVLKGVRTEKSKISPLAYTAGSHVFSFIYPRRAAGLMLVSSPAVVNPFVFSQRVNLKAWHLILKLANLFNPEKEKIEALFALLLRIGDQLEISPAPQITFTGFKIKFVRLLGYGVELKKCLGCRKKDYLCFFSGKNGGVLCQSCGIKEGGALTISPRVLTVMRYLDRVPIEKLPSIKKIPFRILEKINFYLNITLHYHTEMRHIWWTNEKGIFW